MFEITSLIIFLLFLSLLLLLFCDGKLAFWCNNKFKNALLNSNRANLLKKFYHYIGINRKHNPENGIKHCLAKSWGTAQQHTPSARQNDIYQGDCAFIKSVSCRQFFTNFHEYLFNSWTSPTANKFEHFLCTRNHHHLLDLQQRFC